MSTILIPSNILRDTKRMFARLRHQRMTLPVLHHILLQADHRGVRLTATNLDHWIETRVSEDPHEPAEFLIPADAMEAACRADRGSEVTLTSFGGKRSKDLSLVIIQGGIEATSVHPTLDPKEFPERPDLKGEETTLPPDTLRNLAVVAGCASDDRTRHILNGVFFTTGDGGQLVATNGRLLAVSPAVVPPQEFILPNLAAHILD
jgi:DNA polymerase III sliding clamp (beta) subunit (PCNA family)